MSRMRLFGIKKIALAVISVSVAAPAFADDVVSTTVIYNGNVDFANAQPMPLPQSPVHPSLIPPAPAGDAQAKPTPGVSIGSKGDGKITPVTLPVGSVSLNNQDANPSEFGTSEIPFTTSRLNPDGVELSRAYPFRASGKLFFNIGSGSYVCSASLIGRGLVVTAAHCVIGFGTGSWYSNFKFVPAYENGLAPFGVWDVDNAVVMSSYAFGSDSCAVPGVVCQNDVAVMALRPLRNNNYPGNNTGWLGYGWNGYGFNPQNEAQFSQLGYPVSHDAGARMQRTDSMAVVDGTMSNNSVWGSRQTGGSSGGPEVVNLGIPSVLSGGVQPGYEANFNTVVGVTSWGYTSPTVKAQGASPFTSGNIVPLTSVMCGFAPAACM